MADISNTGMFRIYLPFQILCSKEQRKFRKENEMMTKVIWDKLLKTRTIKVTHYEEKKLPKGVYSCPRCDGSGKIMTTHRMFGEHTYMKCGMCDGIGEIIKCKICNENSIPNSIHYIFYPRCYSCHEKYLSEISERKFTERCEGKV